MLQYIWKNIHIHIFYSTSFTKLKIVNHTSIKVVLSNLNNFNILAIKIFGFFLIYVNGNICQVVSHGYKLCQIHRSLLAADGLRSCQKHDLSSPSSFTSKPTPTIPPHNHWGHSLKLRSGVRAITWPRKVNSKNDLLLLGMVKQKF